MKEKKAAQTTQQESQQKEQISKIKNQQQIPASKLPRSSVFGLFFHISHLIFYKHAPEQPHIL